MLAKIKDVLINKYKNKHDNQELNFFAKLTEKEKF